MADQFDPNALLAQLLADPKAFEEQFGAAYANPDDRSEAIRQQMAWAQQMSQPSGQRHSTGQGGMFGAFGDILKGVGGQIRQGQLSGEMNANSARVGQQKQASGLAGARLTALMAQAKSQRKGEADATKAAADAKEGSTKIETGLREEFFKNPVVKSTQEVATALAKVQRAGGKATPAADMALIFAYMKMLDPGSTVREGEYANAQNAAGIPERIVAMYNNAKDGTLLGTNQRNDFIGQANNLYSAQLSQYEQFAKQYHGLAERLGVAPGNVVLDLGFKPVGRGGEGKQSAGGGQSSAPKGQPPAQAPQGLPPDKKARLEELRRKRAEGKLP